jgi:hypothetical protein
MNPQESETLCANIGIFIAAEQLSSVRFNALHASSGPIFNLHVYFDIICHSLSAMLRITNLPLRLV